MLRRLGPALIAFAALIGLAWAQPAIHIDPLLHFDDTAFDYHLTEGYLHLKRDVASNTLLIRLDGEPGVDGIAVVFAPDALQLRDLQPRDSWFPRVPARDLVGVVTTPRSLELPLAATAVDTVTLLREFEAALPLVGFTTDMQLVAGDSYVVHCSCDVYVDTGLRLSLTHRGDTLFLIVALETPLAYVF